MSESDSDLDFESADEDAEFASHAIPQTSAEKCSKEKAPLSDISSVPSKRTDVEIVETSENVSENCTVLGESDPVPVSELSTADDTSSDKQTRNDSTTENETKSDIKDTEENKISPENNEGPEKSSNDDAHNKPSNVEKTDFPPKEKQRVVLRLEKKMQQKSQVSKELPVEKQSPPDSVNPLQPDKEPEKQFSWGFGSWGTSLLSTAASSVSTFSSQVTQGIGTVLETVENTLGAPSPEELAQTLKETKEEIDDDSNVKEDKSTEQKTSWTQVFESTGSMVLMGSLDTLELIGKKTMDMLTDGDPGLRNKRLVFSEKVNLSEILKEAKAKADEQDEKDGIQELDGIHYSQIFDEKQGVVHLEALEMLSKQCQSKFQRLLLRHSKNVEIRKRLEEIKSICENIPSLDDSSDCESFEDFETVFKKNVIELGLPLNSNSILRSQRQINDAISKYETEPGSNCPKEMYRSAISSLAELTAKCIETFHKVSELLLVQPKLDSDAERCATCLTGLTTVMCIEVNNVSSRYHKCLDATAENLNSSELNVTSMATNLYVEAANSNKYIQDAYQMLVPVLQACLLETLD